ACVNLFCVVWLLFFVLRTASIHPSIRPCDRSIDRSIPQFFPFPILLSSSLTSFIGVGGGRENGGQYDKHDCPRVHLSQRHIARYSHSAARQTNWPTSLQCFNSRVWAAP